jgi:hypothetical protein
MIPMLDMERLNKALQDRISKPFLEKDGERVRRTNANKETYSHVTESAIVTRLNTLFSVIGWSDHYNISHTHIQCELTVSVPWCEEYWHQTTRTGIAPAPQHTDQGYFDHNSLRLRKASALKAAAIKFGLPCQSIRVSSEHVNNNAKPARTLDSGNALREDLKRMTERRKIFPIAFQYMLDRWGIERFDDLTPDQAHELRQHLMTHNPGNDLRRKT